MTYRVTGFVFANPEVNPDLKGLIGRLVFQCQDYKTVAIVADNVSNVLPTGVHTNVDFEMRVPLGRKAVWVDANVGELERAATALMEAAQSIRDARRQPKPKPNGASHHDDMTA